MQRQAGVWRTPDGLAKLASCLNLTAPSAGSSGSPAEWEATNLHALSTVLVAAATARRESRGCHRRSDAPSPSEAWAVHLDTTVPLESCPVVATTMTVSQLPDLSSTSGS